MAISPEQQKIVDEAKAKAIKAIDDDFSIIQEYFETESSLARFATNKNMTIWQFKWLLKKHNVPPKAKIHRDKRDTRELAKSFQLYREDEDEEDQNNSFRPRGANEDDDISGDHD